MFVVLLYLFGTCVMKGLCISTFVYYFLCWRPLNGEAFLLNISLFFCLKHKRFQIVIG